MAGITPGAAAQIVDSGTITIMKFSQQQMNSINPSNKFKQFCIAQELEAIKDFIRTDRERGLPSIGYQISHNFIKSINLDSQYFELIDRISQHAVVSHPG